MHFWEALGASSRTKPPLGWPKTSCFPTFLATPAWAIGPKEPLIHLGRSWGGQKPCAFRHFWPPQRGHWPQGAPDPPWPPLGWPKTLCFYAFFANPVRPMAPKGSLGHLGRPWGGQKPCIFTRFWPTQCRPWAPRVPLATLAAPGVAKSHVFLRIFGHPSAAHGPQECPWPPWPLQG